jgi:hypothetical protein
MVWAFLAAVYGRWDVSWPRRGALKRAARPFVETGIFERRDEILFTFAFEFFLGSFEVCDARGNLCAFARQSIVLFAHAHPC